MSEVLLNGSHWIKCITQSGTVRAVSIEATHVVREIAHIHNINGEPSQSLGEAVIAALLVGSYCKSGERVNLNVKSSGSIRQAIVDSRPNGHVRGYVIPGQYIETGKGPWGEGLMAILRTKDSEGEQPYIGTVPLLTGHLAKDLTFYWLQSEQIPTAVGISVVLKGKEIDSANGFLVQSMPGATDQEVAMIQRQIERYDSYTVDTENRDPKQILAHIFQDTGFAILEETPITMVCDCSLERVERALRLVGVAELRAMLTEDRGAEVNCDFCAKKYSLNSENLNKLIALAQTKES